LEKHLIKVKFDAAISHGLSKLVLYFGDPRFSITHFQTDARSQRCGAKATVGVIDKFSYLFSISDHICAGPGKTIYGRFSGAAAKTIYRRFSGSAARAGPGPKNNSRKILVLALVLPKDTVIMKV